MPGLYLCPTTLATATASTPSAPLARASKNLLRSARSGRCAGRCAGRQRAAMPCMRISAAKISRKGLNNLSRQAYTIGESLRATDGCRVTAAVWRNALSAFGGTKRDAAWECMVVVATMSRTATPRLSVAGTPGGAVVDSGAFVGYDTCRREYMVFSGKPRFLMQSDSGRRVEDAEAVSANSACSGKPPSALRALRGVGSARSAVGGEDRELMVESGMTNGQMADGRLQKGDGRRNAEGRRCR